MNGQMKSSKAKIVQEYIQRVNPYEQPRPFAFDLRGYAQYVKDNGLNPKDVTSEVMQKFSREPK